MKLLEYNKDEDNIIVKEEASDKCTFCDDCVKTSREILNAPGAFSVTKEKGRFKFSYECNGVYPPKKVLLLTMDIFLRRVMLNRERFRDEANNIRTSKRTKSDSDFA